MYFLSSKKWIIVDSNSENTQDFRLMISLMISFLILPKIQEFESLAVSLVEWLIFLTSPIIFSTTITKIDITKPNRNTINGPTIFLKSSALPDTNTGLQSGFGFIHFFCSLSSLPLSVISLIACSRNTL